MSHAIRLVVQATVAAPLKQESLTVTHIGGADAFAALSDLQRDRRTGQLVLNLSQGCITNMQLIEKKSLTK